MITYVLLRGLGRPLWDGGLPAEGTPLNGNIGDEPQLDGPWRCIYVEADIFGSQLNTPAAPTAMLSRVRS